MSWLDNLFGAVPTANSAANTTAADVIGNKSDTGAGTSIAAKVNTLYTHFHSRQYVYPSLGAGVVVAAAAGAWAPSAACVEIVPAATITVPFDLHGIYVEALSGAGVGELAIYSGLGGAEVEIGRMRVCPGAAWEAFMQTAVMPANTRISAKFATAAGGAQTATVSVRYHKYV